MPESTNGGLPPLFSHWLGDLLDEPIPAETSATCSDCAMVARDGCAGPAGDVFFDPRLKCCTYLPLLPNFLVGGILSEADPATAAGRATVEARIRAGLGVTPLALDPPEPYSLLYRAGRGLFGRSRTLRCPHYLEGEGLCAIWRHRDAICATWFCKHDRGALGHRFWECLRTLLRTAEDQLARWCVLEIGIGRQALGALFPVGSRGEGRGLDVAQVDGDPDGRASRRVWGDWWGREEEFYRQCARLVAALAWEDVRRICGPDVRVYETLLRDAARVLRSGQLPERLTVAKVEVTHMAPGHYHVVAYGAYDPLDLSLDLLRVLGYFDGRPTAEALNAIAAEEGLRLHPGLVRRLVDHGVLIAPEDAAG